MTKEQTINLGTYFGGDLDGKACRIALDYATETTAFIGRRGSGKTHAAKCSVEDLLAAHVQTVIVDPLDVWWGIGLSADGKHRDHRITVFGGNHGDLPLTEKMGPALADLVVDRGISVVLVVDQLSKAAKRRFVAAFCDRLYDRKGKQQDRTVTHLVLDEVDLFAPQRLDVDTIQCFHAIDEIVRRGRSRGLGSSYLSQRPAVINKDILTQIEILVCFQVSSPQDRKALGEWVNEKGDPDKLREFMTTVAGFKRGEAWIWSPAKLDLFARVKIRQAETYDSSYTPKVGEVRKAAPRLEPIDLKEIEAGLATVIAEAEASDPTKLKATIRELEKQLLAKKVLAPPIDIEALEEKSRAAAYRQIADEVDTYIEEAVEGLKKAINYHVLSIPNVLREKSLLLRTAPKKTGAGWKTFKPGPDGAIEIKRQPIETSSSTLPKGQRAVLSVLAQHGEALAQKKVALLSGYSPRASTWRSILAGLRAGLNIEDHPDGKIEITVNGKNALGSYDPLPTGEDLLAHWRNQLGNGAAVKVFDALRRLGPHETDRESLADESGLAESSSTFRAALAKLRALELMTGKGDALSISSDLLGD